MTGQVQVLETVATHADRLHEVPETDRTKVLRERRRRGQARPVGYGGTAGKDGGQ
jgi:hypothetical protein